MPVSDFAQADGRILDIFATASEQFALLGLGDCFRRVVTQTVHPAKVSHFLEICYANRAGLTSEVLQAAADVGAFAAAHDFYGLGEGQRGLRMVQVLRGEAVEVEPPVDGSFLPPAIEETVEELPEA
jgi:hypothetical protein